MPIPGKLEITIKINQLPTEVTTKSNTWKEFQVLCGDRPVTVALRPRMWTKLEEANKNFPLWVAAISGVMGQSTGKGGFILQEPNLQVFERKARPEEGATPPAEGAPPAKPAS